MQIDLELFLFLFLKNQIKIKNQRKYLKEQTCQKLLLKKKRRNK